MADATDGLEDFRAEVQAWLRASAQGGDVFAYRFDVDDWRDLVFIKLKDLFGAAHALEIPFVFGNFTKPLRVIVPGSMQDQFNTVSSAMGSYWAEFTHSGSPGKGRPGTLALVFGRCNHRDLCDRCIRAVHLREQSLMGPATVYPMPWQLGKVSPDFAIK